MMDEQIFRCHVDDGDGLKVTYESEPEVAFVVVIGTDEIGEHIILDPIETARLAEFLDIALADMGHPRHVDKAHSNEGLRRSPA